MDPDPNLDPKFSEKSDPDPTKIISDPQHWLLPTISPQDLVEESEDDTRFDDISDAQPPIELPAAELARSDIHFIRYGTLQYGTVQYGTVPCKPYFSRYVGIFFFQTIKSPAPGL